MSAHDEVGEPTKRNWLSYAGLLIMSALNAFNDNFARFTLVPLGAWLVSQGSGLPGIQHVLAAMMVIPFILFSPTSGWLADHFAKSRVLHWAAWMQVGVLALMLFALSTQSLLLAVVAFFLLALQSTLMSPAKAGILKELLGSKRLALGSGLMDGVLILAILGGQIISGLVFDHRLESSANGWQAAFGPVAILGVTCLLSLLAVVIVERTRAISHKPYSLAIATNHIRDFGDLWRSRPLRLSALGVAFFWGFGGLLNLIIIQVADGLHGGGVGTGRSISLMMGLASVGIAVGSIATGWLSRRGTELGLVPVGGVLMTLGTILLAFYAPDSLAFRFGLFLAGVGAAVFYVPLRAFLVDACPEGERGKLLGVSNLMSNLSGITAVALQLLMKALHIPVALQFGAMAVLAIWSTWVVMKLLPQQFLKFVGLSLIRSLYRIRIKNTDNFPAAGGVLLCPNHMTFFDALIIPAACPRPVRFLMAEQCFHRKWVGDFARLFHAVPVSPTKAKEAIRIAAEEVAAGNVVCIFPEGQLSRTGAPCEVKKGFEMIARKSDCPVVPVHMHGLWGTFTSFAGGRYFHKWPRKLGAGIRVAFGEPIPPRQAKAEPIKDFWSSQAAAALLEVPLSQTQFADSSCLLDYESGSWKSAVKELKTLPENEFQKLAREALALANVNFWTRGERILLVWDPADQLSQSLAILLPPRTGVKLALADSSLSEQELRKIAQEERCHRLVAPRGILSPNNADSWRVFRPLIIHEWQGDEPELSIPGWFPALRNADHLLTWSMPHPIDPNPMAHFQPGWKSGSVGRLLPHIPRHLVADWQIDEDDFLSRSRESTRSANGSILSRIKICDLGRAESSRLGGFRVPLSEGLLDHPSTGQSQRGTIENHDGRCWSDSAVW